MPKFKLTFRMKAAAWAIGTGLFCGWWYITPYPWLGLIIGLVTAILIYAMLHSGRIERFRRLFFIGIFTAIGLTLVNLYFELGTVQFMQWVSRWDAGYFSAAGGGTGTILYPQPIVLPAVLWEGATFLTQFRTWLTPFPGNLFTSLLYMIPFAVIFLLFGRAYCGWICPLGGLPNLSAALGRQWLRLDVLRVKIQTGEGSHYGGLKPWVNSIKYVLAVIVIFLSFALGFSLINIFFPVLWLQSMPAFWVIVVILVLTAVLLPILTGRRSWCLICPVAAMLAYADRISPFRVKVDHDKCVKCFDCAAACRVYALTPEDVLKGRSRGSHCVKCGRCIEACSEEAVDICWMEGKRKVRMLFISTIMGTALLLYTMYIVVLTAQIFV